MKRDCPYHVLKLRMADPFDNNSTYVAHTCEVDNKVMGSEAFLYKFCKGDDYERCIDYIKASRDLGCDPQKYKY